MESNPKSRRLVNRSMGSLSEEAFDFLLQLETKRAVRYGHFLSLLILEVDQQGQEEAVMDPIAGLIRGQVRSTDLLGFSRELPGSRFRVLLGNSEPGDAKQIGERIRSRVEIHTFQIEHQEVIRTIRGGAATFPEHASDLPGLVATAESMLEQAREYGGNRLMFPQNSRLIFS